MTINKYCMEDANNNPTSTDTTIELGPTVLHPPKGKTGNKPKELVTAEYQGIPVGRDKKVIDPEEVEKLAALGCRDREIADYFGVKEDTLRYNFADNITKGREQLKQSLRRAQLTLALSGNAVMLIWLGKNILGQSDNPTDNDSNAPLPWDSVE